MKERWSYATGSTYHRISLRSTAFAGRAETAADARAEPERTVGRDRPEPLGLGAGRMTIVAASRLARGRPRAPDLLLQLLEEGCDVDVAVRRNPCKLAIFCALIGHRRIVPGTPGAGYAPPMRVGISLLTLVPGEVGGAETYARGLCRGLAEVGTLEYTVFTPPAAPGAGEGLPEMPVPEYRVARSMPERALAMALAAARPGRIRRRLEDVDVLHYALTVAVPKVDAPSVVTLFDLQHLDLPELFSRAERAYRRFAYEGSARNADAVVVNSQFVRRSVIERLGVPPERIHTIPLGIDHDRFTPGGPRSASHSSSTRPVRGRTRTTRDSSRPSRSCARSGPSSSSCSPVAATKGGPCRPALSFEATSSARSCVSLYRRAACLVFPSLYEGFGQPPLEAMACGCPVAASNIPAIAEACGDAAALFDPNDAEDIAAVVAGVLDAPARFVRGRPGASATASPGRRRPAGTRPSTARSRPRPSQTLREPTAPARRGTYGRCAPSESGRRAGSPSRPTRRALRSPARGRTRTPRGSSGSARSAASPLASSSDGCAEATTGVPLAIASTTGMPKPSNREGKANAAAPR